MPSLSPCEDYVTDPEQVPFTPQLQILIFFPRNAFKIVSTIDSIY